MKIINVDINDEIIFKNVVDIDTGVITGISSGVKLPTGNYNNIFLNFSFANQKLCENFNIFASFKINNGTPIVRELEPITIANITYERACDIPNEVFQDKCEVTLGVYGYRLNEDETLDKRFSLVPVRNFVIEGSYDPDSQEGIVPSPTVFEIYFDKINKAEEECQAMLEQTKADYEAFKSEKDAEIDEAIADAESRYLETVTELREGFAEVEQLVDTMETSLGEMETTLGEMEKTVDEAEETVNSIDEKVDGFAGELYAVDRYNKPTITKGQVSPDGVKVIGNAFPNDWTRVSATEYTASNGDILTASGSTESVSSYRLNYAVDGQLVGSNCWQSSPSSTVGENKQWIKMKLNNPLNIKKMATYISATTSSFAFTSAIIQGSNDDEKWDDLHTISSTQTSLTEITLDNNNYYQYYRIYLTGTTTSANSGTFLVYEWQTVEYTTKEDQFINNINLPLTSYEVGKIVNIEGQEIDVYQDDTAQATNIFPLEGWTEVTAGTKYTSNGYIVESSSCRLGNSGGVKEVFSGAWQSDGNVQTEWVKITCPKPTKITKMKALITAFGNTSGFTSAVIQGSKDDSTWVNLHTISSYQSELTEMALENVDYYTYYRILINIAYLNLNIGAQVVEWQVSEWVEGAHTETITSFENPYLNINNLGAKQINGTIKKGEKYNLIYNGENFDIASETDVVTGIYTGAGGYVDIVLGFKPRAVFVYPAGSVNTNYIYRYQAVASEQGNSPNIRINDDGFRASYSGDWSIVVSTYVFQYIAFK